MNKTQTVVMLIGIAVCIIVVWLAPTTVENYRRGKVSGFGSFFMILGAFRLIIDSVIAKAMPDAMAH